MFFDKNYTIASEKAIRGINSYKRTRLLEDFENLSLNEPRIDLVSNNQDFSEEQ